MTCYALLTLTHLDNQVTDTHLFSECSLPEDIRNTPTLSEFKSKLKTKSKKPQLLYNVGNATRVQLIKLRSSQKKDYSFQPMCLRCR